jgi:hypothetical protein
VVVALAAALAVGCGSDDDASPAVTSTAPERTSAGSEAVTVDGVVDALTSDATGSPLAADETAGREEARCVAERLVQDLSVDELTEIGLPDDFDGLPSIFGDEGTTRRVFDPLFDCLDLRPFLIEQMDDLPAARARCIAELVAVDEDVRLLFLVGTTDGSDPVPADAYAEELARLSEYRATCA